MNEAYFQVFVRHLDDLMFQLQNVQLQMSEWSEWFQLISKKMDIFVFQILQLPLLI